MSARITVTKNTRSVLLDVARHGEYFNAGIEEALYAIGDSVVREMRRLIIDPPKTGRIYRFPVPEIPIHQASAPGQPPATMTGRLERELGYNVRNAGYMEVGSQTFYGAFLEDGTTKMKERPFLRVAANITAGQSLEYLQTFVERRLGF